ncbi:hypothetical protein BUE80_DR002555 [Diplocarpon rosae]|nr:hypothetical protein BUE80_DR002555 [Diplocarpon rosae]
MAPARHETGPGQIDSADDKTPYGTRGSSKRKAAELSTVPAAASSSISGTKNSTRSTKTKTAPKKATSSNEPRQPPNKKRRSSSSIAPDAPSSPSSETQLINGHIAEENSINGNGRNSPPSPDNAVDPGSSATPGPDVDSLSQPIPDVQVDPPSALSEDFSNSPIPDDDAPDFPDDTGTSGAGRGRGRGRGGFRGRVYRGRGTRGGRVSKASTTGRGGKPATLSTRGRGSGKGRGGRRKKPEDPVIDVVHKRKTELKAQYKALATFQREALIALAEKSEEMIKSDPKYHETLPEFERVSKGLKDEYEKRQVELDKRLEQEAGLAKRTLDYQEYIVNQQYRLRIEEIQENYEGRLMEHANYIYYKKTKNQRDIDDIPFSKGEDGRIVKSSVPPLKRVHGTGHPFVDPGKAVPGALSTLGDNDYEQHPANWWAAKTKKEKIAILNKQAENVAERERLFRKETGGGRGKKGRQALFQPNAQQESAEGGDAAAEPEEGAEEQPEEEVPANSPPPTGPGSPDEEAEAHVSDNLEDSDAQAQETDEFGVSIPRKKGRRDQNQGPFNRIQADAPVHFEPHEIGLRRTHYAKLPDGSSKKLGRDIDPNPKNGKFFYEQRQGRYNAGKNQPEDLDQEVVAAHNLHPRLGLPIASSINPDRDQCSEPYFQPPTDWSKPWENSNPVMFIHTGLDGKRTISRTSRSEWLYRAKRAFDQIPVAERMAELLEGTGDRESREATPVTHESPPVIAKDLVEAAREAADQEARDELRLEEERRLSQSRPIPQPQPMYAPAPPPKPSINSGSMVFSPSSVYHPQPPSLPPPVSMPPPPQRSHGYDPVRDRTYVTPYSQPVRPTPPPPQHATFANGGNLSELANAADFYGTRPPPAAYNAPINPYGAPPMMTQQQQRLSGVYPSNGHPLIGMFSQYQSSPYGPPPPPSSRGGGANARRAARELRPAPPSAENRVQRGHFSSYGGSSSGRST